MPTAQCLIKTNREANSSAGVAQLGQRRCVQVAVLIGSQVRILPPASNLLKTPYRAVANGFLFQLKG